jgi:hypothetical protein
MLSFFSKDNCLNKSQYECSDKVFKKYINREYFEETCAPICPLECSLTQYKTFLSTSQLIGDKYLDYIRNNSNLSMDFGKNLRLDARSAKESFVKIGIIYDSLSYELSTESPKLDIVSTLANTGDNLGLFTGVSIFSICEVIEVLIEIALRMQKKA